MRGDLHLDHSRYICLGCQLVLSKLELDYMTNGRMIIIYL